MARQDDDKDLLALWQQMQQQDGDFLRRLVEHILQQLLEEEFTAFLGAEPYERTEEREGYRNGHRERALTTRIGKLELLIPRDRNGEFQTELFERYQRSEKAFVLSLMEMYVQGVSTRKVKKITRKLCGIDISRSQVSELAKDLDERVEAWRNRPIEKEFPYLIVDALVEKVRHGKHVKKDAVFTVTGIRADGYRQHLGVWIGDIESKATWSEVFKELRDRGLEGVLYVVSDAHEGIRAAVARYFQGALWGRCQTHFKRNIIGRVRSSDEEWAISLIKDITDADTLQEAREALRIAVEELEDQYPKAADMVEEHGEEILTVFALPEGHWRRMRPGEHG